MPQYKTVVFDLDGTLLDTSIGILSSVRYTIDKFQLEEPSEEVLKTFIGPPIQKSFKRVYGLDEKTIQDMADTFRNHYKDVDLLKAKPYEGIFELFSSLKENGIMPSVATYKREDYALNLLKHFGFDQYTNIMFGSDFEGLLTKKDIILKAIKEAGCEDYSEAVMVGDSDNDAIGANELGVDFIGVTYGFGFHNEEDVLNYTNVGVAKTTDEILKIVLGE